RRAVGLERNQPDDQRPAVRLAAATRTDDATQQRPARRPDAAAAVPASEEELAPEARRAAAVVQAPGRHPRQGAVRRRPRGPLSSQAARRVNEAPTLTAFAAPRGGAAGLGAARRPAGGQ